MAVYVFDFFFFKSKVICQVRLIAKEVLISNIEALAVSARYGSHQIITDKILTALCALD